MRNPVAVLTAALFLTACGAAGPADELMVRDSAGVRLVDNPELDGRVAFVLEAEPEVNIGSLDGPEEYTFQGISGAARLDDGRILVTDATELKFYDPTGAHLLTAGGEGEGPGEFSFAPAVFPCGDWLVAGDFRQPYLTLLDMDGAFVRTVPLPESGNMFFSMRLVGCDDATGRPLLRPPPPVGPGAPEPDAAPTTLPILRLDLATETLDTVVELPSPPRTGAMQSPFAEDVHYAFGHGGIHVTRNGEVAVRTYGLDGALRQIARRPYTPRPLTPEENARAIDAVAEEVPSGFAEQMREQMEAAPVPSHVPVVGGLLVDDAGRVWIRPFSAPGQDRATTWEVMDGDGTHLGIVEMPAGFRPTHVAGDRVVGVWTDDLDVGHLQVYRFRAPS